MSYTITIEIYDKETNLIDSFNFCKYFKVTKNSILNIGVPIYNQYQFFIEIPKAKIDVINPSYIYRAKIFNDKNEVFSVFIFPTTIEVIKETPSTLVYNILGMSYNMFRFINEEILCRISDYDKYFKIFNVTPAPFTTSFFTLLHEGILKLINIVYGPYLIEANFTDQFINTTSLTIQNLPLLKNLDTINYIFNNFHPILDYPFFAIDDFIPINTDKNFTGKIILNSYQNIEYFKENLILNVKNLFRIKGKSVLREIPISKIFKFAYGDYIYYNVDHYTTETGPFYTVPRAFGLNLKIDEIKSFYTVKFDYPINKIDLQAIRQNYQYLSKKDFMTYLFQFINVNPEFIEINKIFEINKNKYYVYGNEFEFNPINIRSNQTIFKLDGAIKTLKID